MAVSHVVETEFPNSSNAVASSALGLATGLQWPSASTWKMYTASPSRLDTPASPGFRIGE